MNELNTLERADIYLIERQPGRIGNYGNNDALVISHLIEYHFMQYDKVSVFMSPKLKNSVVLHPSCQRDIKDYKKRKQQSVENFKYFIKQFNITYTKQQSTKLDDIADAFCQIIAYLRGKHV
jgi:hypothetical protein